MKPNIQPLAFIPGLLSLTLVVPLWVHYRMDRAYRGMGWWLSGSILTALGFIFLSLLDLEVIGTLSCLGNPLLMAGRVCILVGVVHFLERRPSSTQLAALWTFFVVVYYVFLLGHPSLAARTITVSAALALFSFMTAHQLLSHNQPGFRGAARFTAGVFLAHGCFLLINIYNTLHSLHIESHLDYSPIQKAAFVIPIVTSTLWTFGLVLMISQRLSAENIAEKLKLQQALGALQESEATYRSILNASPDNITITDLKGDILIASPAALAMFGHDQAEEQHLSILDDLVSEDRARAQSNLDLLAKGNREGPNEYRGIRKDRSTFDIEVNSGLIDGAQGQPAKLVFVVRDISERKKAECARAEMEARNRQLQKAESLNRMAGAISHHFNNKLQSVLANLEIMESRLGRTDPRICLSRARQAAEQASEVSRLMLAYLGQTAHEHSPLALSKLYQSSLPLLQGTLPPQTTLSVQLPSPSPIVRGNEGQLQQVLINLVTNAWEALGKEGGKIRLALRVDSASAIPSAHRVPVDWQPQSSTYICMEVADSGPGIPLEHLEKLFDPYFSTRLTGRGMGLPVVLGIVQAHGGGLSVESRPGQGSVFRVYLPACEEALPHPAEGTAPSPGAAESNGTILLVDDDAPLLETTSEFLEIMGFSVLPAQDGIEAIELFQAHRNEIRCVITDLTMPRLDGWGTLSALRQLDPAMPVILMSAYDQVQSMGSGHPDHPQTFLGKPFKFKQLQEAVATTLGSPMPIAP